MDEQAKALTLPKAAQEGILEGLGKAIEALSGLLDLAKSAQTTDDAAAAVPPEFAEALERAGLMIAALGDQYEGGGGDGGAPGGGEAGPELAPEDMVLAKEVAKAIAKKLVTMCSKVAKGKVKMSFEQAMKLHSGLMRKLYSIASELAPMVAELGGDVSDALALPPPGGDAGGDVDKTNKGAPPAQGGNPPPPAAAPTLAASVKSIEGKLDELAGVVKRVAKSRPAPSVAVPSALEGAAPPPVERLPYGENLSKRQREKEAAEAAKK